MMVFEDIYPHKTGNVLVSTKALSGYELFASAPRDQLETNGYKT